jgi:hypothetical protein
VFAVLKNMKKGPLLILLMLSLWTPIACSEKLDFDQFDELDIIPFVEAAMLYLETPEAVLNSGLGSEFLSVEFDFLAFSEQFVADRILEGSIIYQATNTTSKPLVIRIEFLDDSGSVLDTEVFELEADPTPVLDREVFYGGGGNPWISFAILRS